MAGLKNRGRRAKRDAAADTEHTESDGKVSSDLSRLSEKAPKRGGGKLGRTETVTVRLDSKLRYLAGLVARKHRRTLSSFVEWALEQQTNQACLDDSQKVLILEEGPSLWDVDDADRFAKLAIRHPTLLTHNEQLLWKLIRENGSLWRGYYDDQGRWSWKTDEKSLFFERLRNHWESFILASESGDWTDLPTWKKEGEPSTTTPQFFDDDGYLLEDLDDHIGGHNE